MEARILAGDGAPGAKAFHPEDVFSLSLMGIFTGKKELKRNRHLVHFTGNSKSTSIKREKCHAFVKHSCEQQPNDR